MNTRGTIRVEEVPAPECGSGEIKIALTHSLISSGTETHTIRVTGQNLVSRAKDRPDLVKKVVERARTQGVQSAFRAVQQKLYEPKSMGYSASGTVLEVGADVTGFRPGDRVACGGSTACHAELVSVPENLVVLSPNDVFPQQAAFATLGAIAMQGVRRAKIELGDNVVVLGLGLVGQLAVQMARLAGAHVIGFDLASDRVELAKRLGADEAYTLSEADAIERVTNFTRGVGADAVIVAAATPSSQPINDAVEMARERGRISILGIIGLDMQHTPFYMKELDVYMSRSYGPGRYDVNYEDRGQDYPISFVRWTENRNMAQVLRLIADGKLDVDSLISDTYPIHEAERAYSELQEEGSGRLGLLLEYPEQEGTSPVAIPTASAPRSIEAPIRIAFIGCGGFAKLDRLPHLAKSKQYKIEMLVSRTGAKVKQLAGQYGVSKYVSDWREAMADDVIDAVFIATPNSLHAPITVAAAEAGKHVFVEKPMAVNPEELEAVREAVAKAGIRFTCGFNRRFAPASGPLKAFVEARREPKSVLYRCNVGLIPPGHFMHPPEEGGGLITGEACHFFDYCTWLLGAEPLHVSAASIAYDGQHFVGADNLSSVVTYSDGSTATVVYTTMGDTRLAKERVEVYCGGACAVLDDYTATTIYGAKDSGWSGSQDKGHRATLDAFACALIGDNDLPCGLDEAYASHRLTFEAIAAARQQT